MRSGYVQYKVDVKRDAETEQLEARVPSLGVGVNGPDGPDAATTFGRLWETAGFHVASLVEGGAPLPCSDEGAGVFLRLSLPVGAQVAVSSDEPAPSGDYVQYSVNFEWDEETRQLCVSAEAIPMGDYGDYAASALERFCDLMNFDLECLVIAGASIIDSDEGEGLYIRARIPSAEDVAHLRYEVPSFSS